MDRGMKIGLALFTVGLLALLLAGPFYIFPVLAPLAGPILPRPAAVPRSAEASYDWKGSGLSWRWERRTGRGCLRWYATKTFGVVSLSTTDVHCEVMRGVQYTTSGDHLDLMPGRSAANAGGQPCPFYVTTPELQALRELAIEMSKKAETEQEADVLRRVARRLARVDGNALTRDVSGGCNDLKPEDYGRPRTRIREDWR